jgi:hypothetical protein
VLDAYVEDTQLTAITIHQPDPARIRTRERRA